MNKEDLIKKIKTLGFENEEIAVSLEEYFEQNDIVGSIIPNSYPDEVNPKDLYKSLKELKGLKSVQDIFVRICEIEDEEWPYSDSIYLYTTLSDSEIREKLSKYSPDEIVRGWMYGKPKGVYEIEKPNQVLTIWWD